MALGRDFLVFAQERLAVLGTIRIKMMFGGAGVYCDELFFALLDDGQLYLKADDDNRAAFEKASLKQFMFQQKDGRAVGMSYYAAPETVFDDEDEMCLWAGLALGAARRAAVKKPAKPKARRGAKATLRGR